MVITIYCLSWAGDEFEKEQIIHYLGGHKGKIYDFAAVEAKRCDKITYHIAKLLKDNELCDDVLGSAGPAQRIAMRR